MQMQLDRKFEMKTYDFFAILLNIACLLTLDVVHFSSQNAQVLYTFYAYVSLIELLIFFMANSKANLTILNFTNIFVGCLYLFHYGQVVLMGVFPEACQNLTIVLRYFNQYDLFEGLRWINRAMVLLYIGIILANEWNKDYTCERHYNLYLGNYAFFIIVLTFPVKLSIDLAMLFVGIREGFDAAKAILLTIPDMIVTYGNFAIIGFCMGLIALRKQKMKQMIAFGLLVAYTLMVMISGRRSENVAYLLIYIYIFLSDKKIKMTTILKYGVIGYLILTFLNAVVYMRNESIGIVQAYLYTITTKNIFFEVLREYGNTGYTALSVIINWLKEYEPSAGTSYYMGITAAIPNFGGIMGKLTQASCFQFALQNGNVLSEYYQNIGGSIIGEWFFNFGTVGAVIVAFIFGIIVGTIGKRASVLIAKESEYSLFYYVTVMPGIIYWIRDYFGGICRQFIWGVIFCWIISMTRNWLADTTIEESSQVLD